MYLPVFERFNPNAINMPVDVSAKDVRIMTVAERKFMFIIGISR